MNGKWQDIETRSRELFEGSVDGIDGATRSRLTQARHAALAELDRPRLRLGAWLPAGAAAGAAMLAVMLWTQPGPAGGPATAVAASPADDFILLTEGEDLELFGEDIEFYAWAASLEAGNGQG